MCAFHQSISLARELRVKIRSELGESCLFPLHTIQERIKGTPGERALKRTNLGMTHHGSSALKRVLALDKLPTCMGKRPFRPGSDL